GHHAGRLGKGGGRRVGEGRWGWWARWVRWGRTHELADGPRIDDGWRVAGDGAVHVTRAGAWEGSRQADGHLGVRLRAIRDAHRPPRVRRRDNIGHHCFDSGARTGLDRAAAR